jgi:hypothetical protein
MKKNLQQDLDVKLEKLGDGLLVKLGREDIKYTNVAIAKDAGEVSFYMGLDGAKEECANPGARTPLEQRLGNVAEKNGFDVKSYLTDIGMGKDYVKWLNLYLAGSLEDNKDGVEEEETEKEEAHQTLKDELANELDEVALVLLSEIDGFDIAHSCINVYRNPFAGVSVQIYFSKPVRELCSWSPAKKSFLEEQVSALARKNGFDTSYLFNPDEMPGSYPDHVEWAGLFLGTSRR